MQPKIFPLEGQIQPYAWGGFSYLRQLVGKEAGEQSPAAEYWLGAHPAFPARVQVNGSSMALDQFIAQDPEGVLGRTVFQAFGSLPFLLKVLDVRQMLSIQVHPSKAAAEAAFRSENEAGVPLAAPHRNYKDENHKPELMVALNDFWLLHGFKPVPLLRETLFAIPEFSFLLEEFDRGGYKALYEKVMLLDQPEVDRILGPVAERILPLYRNGELPKHSEDFWAARAVDTFCTGGRYDRGIFSVYFFNLLRLKPGEAIYQPAGMPHAYLEGQNVEIMANSDNVLRAGLTDKHIDVPELLKHVRFEATCPRVLVPPGGRGETCFATEAREFELYRYRLEEGEAVDLRSGSAEILLVLSGITTVQAGNKIMTRGKGASVFIAAGSAYRIRAEEKADVFRATVPEQDPA